MVNDKIAVTIFYNGSCRVCRREIAHYRRLAERAGASLAWCDVTTQANGLEDHGIAGDDALRRLHAIDTDGRLLAGIDAFVAVWERLPRWAWLASMLRWRPLRWFAEQLYEGVVAPRLVKLHRRRMQRAGALAKVPCGR